MEGMQKCSPTQHTPHKESKHQKSKPITTLEQQSQNEITIRKQHIKKQYIYLVEGYVGKIETKKMISQDIVNLILFFYAKPIKMKIKLNGSNQSPKIVLYSPQQPEWHSLETNILKKFDFKMKNFLRTLIYKHGNVTASNWKYCRWNEKDEFIAVVTSDIIMKMDNALSREYKLFNRNDYFNSDGKGKLIAFLEDNDMDTDTVLDELGQNPNDCSLIELDDNFPLQDDQKHDRDEAIYNIIKKCYEIPNAEPGSEYRIELNKEHFMILSDEEIEKVMSKDKTECEKQEELESMRYDKLKTMTDIFIDSCYAVMSRVETDQNYLQLLYISQQKLNGKPYIHLLCDLYARDRINHYLQIKPLIKKEFDDEKHNINIESVIIPKLNPYNWSLLNKHTKIISQFSDNKKELKILQGGINSYFHRLTPLMDVSTSYKINDDYESICQYIANAVDFVHNLARDEEYQQDQYSAVCPFQYDFVIAFNHVICDEKKVPANVFDDDDDDDDDIKDPNEGCDDPHYFDCFGNIKRRLADAGCVYNAEEIDINVPLRYRPQFEEFRKEVKNKLPPLELKRQEILEEVNTKLYKSSKEYEELKNKVQKWYDKAVELRENQKDLSDQDKETVEKLEKQLEVFTEMERRAKELIQEKCSNYDVENYPRRFRFISVLDRREPSDENKEYVIENDELIFFEPPRNCFNFAKDKKCDNVKYFSNSKECIIPKDKKFDELIKLKEHKDYKEDKKQKELAQQILQTKVINTLHSMKNGMLVLSFHVESIEEIRCYIYLQGNMVRFLGEDLKGYLPEFFIDNDRNKAFWNSTEKGGDLDSLIESINDKLIDRRFEGFYRHYKLNDNTIQTDITKKMKSEIDRLKKEKTEEENRQKQIDTKKMDKNTKTKDK